MCEPPGLLLGLQPGRWGGVHPTGRQHQSLGPTQSPCEQMGARVEALTCPWLLFSPAGEEKRVNIPLKAVNFSEILHSASFGD